MLSLIMLIHLKQSPGRGCIYVHSIESKQGTSDQTHLGGEMMTRVLTFQIVYGKINEVEPVIDFIRFAAN